MTGPSNVAQYARAYQKKGWACFPLAPRSKEPIAGSGGFKDATITPRQWPLNANIAIATGAVSGLVVIDVDTETGQRSLYSLFARHTRLPDTPVCLTPRGRHIYFRHPGGRVACAVGFAPGLDCRADGGYVVAPPSVRNNGRYTWHPRGRPGMVPLAEPPLWLLEILRPKPRPVPETHQGRRCGINGRTILEGERNVMLFKICCSLIKDGHDDIVDKMLAINNARCQPPQPEAEVRRMVEHAVRRYG